MLHNSPSQIYHTALPLSPSSSWLHKHYMAELSQEVGVVKGFSAEWEMSSRTVALDNQPLALACWGDVVAVGLGSGDIIILNAITGSQVAALSGHIGQVESLAFSLDGTSLVSGGDDMAPKLWDVQTGGVIKTFHGHTSSILSVSISADYTIIASGSSDKTIRLWDIWTGECLHVIKQQGDILYVVFSLTHPTHLISVSGCVFQEWDIGGHQVRPIHDGYQLGPIYEGPFGAFSSNGTCFISCTGDVATVQNSDTGAIVAKCLAPDNNPNPDSDTSSNPNAGFNFETDFICPCFSPNGRLVAVAAGTTIYVWDIISSDPLLTETLIGHASPIVSLVFSSSSTLISASTDQLVKFWKFGGLSTDLIASDQKSTPPTSVPIQSVSLQAESCIATSSDSDGVLKVWDISTGLCKASFQTPAEKYDPRDAQMIDGRLIFVWADETMIQIQDAEKGEIIQSIEQQNRPSSLRISGDGSQIFCLIGDYLQVWSIWTGEVVGQVEVGYNSSLNPLYMGGSRIWVDSKDKPLQGWDFGISDSSPVPLSNTPSKKTHLHFVHSIDQGSNDPSRIEDTVTGKVVFQLSGRYAKPSEVQWNGQYLVAGYESGELLILDFDHLYLE
jgi:WD40 repeat protein